jgi:hypothetical protein
MTRKEKKKKEKKTLCGHHDGNLSNCLSARL